MEWVEVQARTIEAAVQAAVEELGLESVEQVEVEVLQEPVKGFLGMGGQDAIVRVKKAPRQKKRRRGGRGRAGEGKKAGAPVAAEKSGPGPGGREGNGGKRGSGSRRRGQTAGQRGGTNGGAGQRRGPRATKKEAEPVSKQQPRERDDQSPVDVEEQARVVKEFLEGLITAFGLEGAVDTSIDGDTISAEVSGEQTEALVGPKGSILQAVLELVKIVVQRKTQRRARIRLDIAGYGERRRQALKIYTVRLIEKVQTEGGEIMLEPMNPADRKVVHDVVADYEGVRSWSEGEEPNRSVIIGLAPGFSPASEVEGEVEVDGGAAATEEAEPDGGEPLEPIEESGENGEGVAEGEATDLG